MSGMQQTFFMDVRVAANAEQVVTFYREKDGVVVDFIQNQNMYLAEALWRNVDALLANGIIEVPKDLMLIPKQLPTDFDFEAIPVIEGEKKDEEGTEEQ